MVSRQVWQSVGTHICREAREVVSAQARNILKQAYIDWRWTLY
jgi:hypothetical protein